MTIALPLYPRLLRSAALAAGLLAASCNDSTAADPAEAANALAAGTGASDAAASVPEAEQLAMPPSWMPEDWDRNVYQQSGELAAPDPQFIAQRQQAMLNTVPFTLWAVANDTLVTEAFEPIWVWYTAIRSCERGIQLSEDLAGEFGDQARGEATLKQARAHLKRWAATQPRQMTLYFPAALGQWNAQSGAFALQSAGQATTVRPADAARFEGYSDGATVQLWNTADARETSINHFQASLLAPHCPSPDGQRVYKFEKMSQWWVVFGEAERGMGGLVNYRSRQSLPPISMTREEAARFAQRNPERKVEVAVTFEPVGSSFVQGTDQSTIRAKFVKVTVADALDGSVLASRTY